MQFVGGKQKSGGHRIAAHIRRVAWRMQTNDVDEPMCGGLSVTSRLSPLTVHASDACKPLIALYRSMLAGWEPPNEVSRDTWEHYKALRHDPALADDPMLAFVGFGCSRSGAWFSSYIHDYKYTDRRVPAAQAARDSLRKKLSMCTSVSFDAMDYANVPVRGVWYCDKPYINTLDYPAVAPFDHDRFWTHVTDVSKSVPVLVSERQAPEGWIVLDEWGIQQRMTTAHGDRRIERIYVHDRWGCLVQ